MNNTTTLESFKIIGISVKTTNKNAQSQADIGKLWEKFYSENVLSKIPGRLSDDIYSIYTDYKSDYTEDYTTIIGCRVQSLDNIPQGFTGKQIEKETYRHYIVTGKLPDAVANTWKKIWADDQVLNRKYSADFEVYGKKSSDPNGAKVDIYIAVK